MQRIFEYIAEEGIPANVRRASIETTNAVHYLLKDPSQDPALIDIPIGRRDL